MHEILADVYKKGNIAGYLSRTDHGGTAYTYAENYIESDGKPISSTLPIRTEEYLPKLLTEYFARFFPLPRACWNRLRKSCPSIPIA